MICNHPSGECTRPVIQGKMGYCSMHYTRLRKKGELGGVEALRNTGPSDGSCQHPDGCARLVMAKGLCGMHYNRVLRGRGLGPSDGWDTTCGQCGQIYNTIYTFASRCSVCASDPKCFQCGGLSTTHSGKLCGRCRAWSGAAACPGVGCTRMVQKGSKSGLCRSCSRRGSMSANWNGGRSITKDGYARIIAPEGYSGVVHNGYAHEHRVVMEQHLDRLLVKGETVHHKNGVRDDNRIENLELWSSSQPSGQRVEDKVQWAKEMLRLYAPEALTQEERSCHKR